MKYYLKGESIDEAIKEESPLWTKDEILSGETVANDGDVFIEFEMRELKKVRYRLISEIVIEETE